MKIEIMNWVINALIFSLPFTWYMIYQIYKDLKEKDKIIKLQEKILNTPSIMLSPPTEVEIQELFKKELEKYDGTSYRVEMEVNEEIFIDGAKAVIDYMEKYK